jgi:hypothetical protein
MQRSVISVAGTVGLLIEREIKLRAAELSSEMYEMDLLSAII